MRMQSTSCQSLYFVWVLDTRMQSSSCQSWNFVWVFGYEDAELILLKLYTLSEIFGYVDAKLIVPNLVLCLGFSI